MKSVNIDLSRRGRESKARKVQQSSETTQAAELHSWNTVNIQREKFAAGNKNINHDKSMTPSTNQHQQCQDPLMQI